MSKSRAFFEKLVESFGYKLIRKSSLRPEAVYGMSDLSIDIPKLKNLSDTQLDILNEILPWSSFVLDGQGRPFGRPFSTTKRSHPEIIPDLRIVELNKIIPLAKLSVLEVGCHEGHHTVALCKLSDQVTAIDARIEHVIKTLVRCFMFDATPTIHCFDLEDCSQSICSLRADVLVHIGVLYHLSDPVRHLSEICSRIDKAILLDTHIAPIDAHLNSYEYNGASYKYYRFAEHGLSSPFAGTRDHAKWLDKETLIEILSQFGFTKIEVLEERMERNGPRIKILVRRNGI